MARPYKPHLYKAVEWQQNGYWYCADTSDLAHDSSAWWVPFRVLGISPEEFILLLRNEYNCTHISWTADTPWGGFLHYYWDSQADMRRFKNYLNKVARQKQFFI